MVIEYLKKPLTVLSDSKYLSPKVLGLIRHAATVIGTILVFLGYVDNTSEVTSVIETLIDAATSVEGVIGIVSVALGAIGSWFAKEKQK